MAMPMLRLFDGFKHTSPELRDEVKILQRELNQEGFKLKLDGHFGRETEMAVQWFQRAHSLDDDGVVGPLTWAALLREPAPVPEDVFETTYASNNAALLQQLDAAQQFRSSIEEGAKLCEVPPCVIVGIGSRESQWGMALKPPGPGGTGDFLKRRFPTRYRNSALPPDGGGFGRGLLQIDYDVHAFAREGAWRDAHDNILYGCSVLQDALRFMQRKTELQGRALLCAAIAAYNCGPGNVLKAHRARRDVDFYTAGRDYSADVLNRTGFFQMNGW